MSFAKSLKEDSSRYQNKDSVIFHECKDGESSKKFILRNTNSRSILESSLDKCLQKSTSGQTIPEDINNFSEMSDHNSEDETVTLLYQTEGMTLLSAGENQLVNLVELSSIEGGTNSLDLDTENLEYGNARIILQQDFDSNGEISVVTTDISDSQLELLQSRLHGNETLALFQGETNLLNKEKISNSTIPSHLIQIPSSEVMDHNSIPLSLVSDPKGVQVIQNFDRHFLTTIGYENDPALLPITLTSEDILASEDTTYTSSRRNSDILVRCQSEDDIVEESLKLVEVKQSKAQKQGQVGRPKKHLCKTIGTGPNAISCEGVVQEINNRLVTVLPRPEDVQKLLDGKQLVTLKANGRGSSKQKIKSDRTCPVTKFNSHIEDDTETSQIYVDLAAAQVSKSFSNLKPTSQPKTKKRSKSSTVVISSTGRRPGRPRKAQTIMSGSKGPKIIHTGPNSDKNDSMLQDKIDDSLFNREAILEDTYKEREFDFYNNKDILKKKLPPRKRGMRYQKLIEELKKSEGDDDSFSEDDESPDFLTNQRVSSPKPKISTGTGKRGRPRKRPLPHNENSMEDNGTRIIQLGENFTEIMTSTTSSVLVKDGIEASDKSMVDTQNNLIITFDYPERNKEKTMTIDNIAMDTEDLQANFHIDTDTNISLVPQYDAALESATIFVKEDGRYEEGFACEHCPSIFESKRDFLRHLKVKHGQIPLDCTDCGRSFTCASSLRNHEAIHGLENGYCCNVCNKGFSNYAELQDHQIIHSAVIECRTCNGKFVSRDMYQNHLSDCFEFKCKFCFDRFTNKNMMELHQCQDSDKRFLCDICNAFFLSSSGLNKHRKVHTRSNNDLDKGLKCPHCLAHFSFLETLDAHVQTVHREHNQNGYDCIENGNEKYQGYAPSTAELYDVPNENEIRDQSLVQPFLCGICDNAFSDIDLLCDHFNCSHTGEQPLFCAVCSVGCVNESQLAMHMKIHNKEEVTTAEQSAPTIDYPFMCKLCPKRFKKENELEKHIKLHNGLKKFKCIQCPATFRIKSTLDKHLLMHSGKRPYVCDICFKGFRQSGALVRHKLWTHRLKNKNKCEICCKTFFSRSLLIFHLESHGELGEAVKDKMTMEATEQCDVERDQCLTDELTCEFCGTECPSIKALVSHKSLHKLFSCNICHRSFKEKKKLKKHRLKHRTKPQISKSWACDICDKSFATKLTRVRHSHVHLREALNPIPKLLTGDEAEATGGSFPYELFCKECNVPFQHKSHFVRHKLLHAGIPLFKCGICEKMFVHKSDIFRHKVLHSFMFSCNVCGKNFHKRSLYVMHTRKHLFEKPFKCDICDKRFITNSSFLAHSRIHSGEKPYKCNICNYSCTQSGRLMRHRQVHSGIKMFSCEICNKQLSTIESLKIHTRIHTGERPYKCNQCSKSFLNRSSLNIHKKDHFNEEAYKCDLCLHKFKKEAHLAKHKLFHQIQQQYVGSVTNEVFSEHLDTPLFMCDICGRVFNKKKYLYNHHNVHSPSRKFPCNFCSKILFSKIALKNHMLIHSGEMPHKCAVCNKSFRNLTNMKRHERIHTTQQSFQCEECNTIFYQEQALEDHKQAHLNLMMDSVNSTVSQHLYVFDTVEQSMNDAMQNTQQLLVDNAQQLLVDNSQQLLVDNPQQMLVDNSQQMLVDNPQQMLVDNPQQQFIVDDSPSLLVFTDNSNAYSEIVGPQDSSMEMENDSMCTLSPQETEVIQPAPQLKITEEKANTKPHQCDVCLKNFSKRQYLTKHKYRHREVKPHPCDICGKRFAQKFEVVVHKMKHTGDKPYKCDECGKDFRSKANLINHKMKHTGEYPFMCSICSKGLSTQIQLERHVILHTGTYPFKCGLCQKGFPIRSNLAKHLEKVHMVNIENQLAETEVDINLEPMQAISSITDICVAGIKSEFPIPDEMEAVETFSDEGQPQFLKTCLLSETSVIENKFLTSILQTEESSSTIDVSMTDLSDNLN